MKLNKRVKTLTIIMIFLLGLGLFAYPIVSNLIYNRAANKSMGGFEKELETMEQDRVAELLNLAHAYNDLLSGRFDVDKLEDPYLKEKKEAGVREYARMLELNEQIGSIQIPKIGLSAPLYAGSSEEVLQKGVGHMEGTSLPVGGAYTHAVLTAHRGLPKAKLFTDLHRLEIGDVFHINNLAGRLTYEVDQIKTVEPTDFSDLSIVPEKDYCTLLTCTPYMINSHRLLVRGRRIDYENEAQIRGDKAIETEPVTGTKQGQPTSNADKHKSIILIIGIVLLILIIIEGYRIIKVIRS